MTHGEKLIWVGAFSASWNSGLVHGIGLPIGRELDAERARTAAIHADRALDALRMIADPAARRRSSDSAVEVMK